MSVHRWEELRATWNTYSLPPLRMAKTGMKMAVKRRQEERPLSGQLLGEAAVSGWLSSLPGEAVPTDRKDQHSTRGTRSSDTVAISTEQGPAAPTLQDQAPCLLVWGILFFVFCKTR